MDKLRIFLSGPMTGHENFNFDKFNFIENVLKQYGVDVVNPVHICKKYKKEHVLSDKAVFDKMVAEQQEAEKTCNAIMLLHGWQNSKGVMQLETALSQLPTMNELKKKVMYELGLCAEDAGDDEKAYEYYRDIYAADIGFADLNGRMMVLSKAIKYKKEHEKK